MCSRLIRVGMRACYQDLAKDMLYVVLLSNADVYGWYMSVALWRV